ncbi:MAG: glycosyltransferase family 4 protein [Chitinophagales bacterium]|nr:glycosyltransferase family 4 protein [Chitinophagales bacterium]
MTVYLFSANFYEYTIELANELANLCNVVLSLPENRISEKHKHLINKNVTFEPFKLVDYKSIRDNFAMFYGIAKIIRKHNPDVIHIQSHGLKNFWWLLPFTRGKILVNTIHDPSTHSGDVVSAPNPWNNSMINRFTDKVIVHGEILKKETVYNFGFSEHCVTVIPHGHLGLYKAWRNETYPKEQCLFLFFGRIWPYKGLNYFIEAANLLSEENKNARFVIAGKGEDIEKYTSRILHPEQFEIRNKRITEEEIDELFQKAFCTVLPYTDATQSGVIPIAYSYKVLVIASAVGALPEVVENNVSGILVPPKDARSLYEKMKWSLENTTAINGLTENAFALTSSKLSWKTIAALTIKVYASK